VLDGVDLVIYFLGNKKNLINYNLLFPIFQGFNELSDEVFQREIGGLGQYSVLQTKSTEHRAWSMERKAKTICFSAFL
jgi:hypothetical protein